MVGERNQQADCYGQVRPNFVLFGGKMRLRLRKILQYVFFASIVLLIYREFERIAKSSDDRGPRSRLEVAYRLKLNGNGKEPLVAGINPFQQRPARRSPGAGLGLDDGGGGHGDGDNYGGARGREPLWQDGSNNNNHLSDQLGAKSRQRGDGGSEVESKENGGRILNPIEKASASINNRTKLKDGSEFEGKLKNFAADGRTPQGQVLSIAVNEPKPEGEPIPPIQIKDLSSLVGRRPAPAANFTIVVHNPAPGDAPPGNRREMDRQTELSDVFIGVKTTEKYHKDRLQIILDTWYSLAPEQTYFFTDIDDEEFQHKSNGHMINTQCQGTHSRLALCCKTSVIFNMFYKSDKRWLCHVDDDNYLNVPELLKLLRQYDHSQDYYLGRASLSHPIEAIDRDTNQKVSFWFATGGAGFCISRALANKMAVYASSGTFERMCNRIRLPDDVTLGFIIEVLLKKPMVKVQGFNSHLQQLRSIQPNQLQHQITLSYSITDKRVNIINMPSSLFHIDQDPTRFKTFHCTYFRGYGNCPTR